MFSYAEKVPSYCFSYYTVFSVSFVIKAPRSQATKVIHIKKSSWTIKIRFSVATLFVRQGVLQQWHKKMLWALRSSEEHEKLLGFSPLAVLFTYHGNIHLLWKRWKREACQTAQGCKNSAIRLLISRHNKTNEEMGVSISHSVIYALL